MMWACTCGELHPLATMTRCDDGTPTPVALEQIVEAVDDLATDVGFPLDEWQLDRLRQYLDPSPTRAGLIGRAYHVGATP